MKPSAISRKSAIRQDYGRSPEFDPIFYRSAYAKEPEVSQALKHYLTIGRYLGLQPARRDRIGLKATDWLGARRPISPKVDGPVRQISWCRTGRVGDPVIARLLEEELTAYAGGAVEIRDLGQRPDVASWRAILKTASEDAYIGIIDADCLISRHDIGRLIASLDDHPDDVAALPLAVTPDLAIVDPPIAADGSEMAANPDIDHPDYNYRRQVLATNFHMILVRAGALHRAIDGADAGGAIDLDRLGARKPGTVAGGCFLVPGASVRLPKGKQHPASLTSRRATTKRSVRRRILYVDSTVPCPDLDAGSDTAWRVVQIMQDLGYDVTFVPTVAEEKHRPYIEALQRIGVKVVHPPYSGNIATYLERANESFDVAFLARAAVVATLIEPIRERWPNCRIIFNTVDLHYLRLIREAVLHRDTDVFAEAMRMKEIELEVIEKADRTIVLSELERDELREEGFDARVTVVPPMYDAARSYPFDPLTRRGIFFLGGYAHTPNVDAVDYFVTQVWPLVTAHRADIVFHIVGANMPAHFASYESDTVKVVGFVKDVDEFMSGMRLMVSPLRYGAGIKVKVIASLSAGVPVLATPPSIEGTGIAAGDGYRVASTKEDFAASIQSLYDDEAALIDLSLRGKAAVKARYSAEALRTQYVALLDGHRPVDDAA